MNKQAKRDKTAHGVTINRINAHTYLVVGYIHDSKTIEMFNHLPTLEEINRKLYERWAGPENL